MTIEEKKALVARFVSEVEQDGKLERLDDFVSPDFVDRTPLPGIPPTRDGIRALFGMMQTGFSDFRVTVLEQVAEGERVVTHKRFTGRHTGEFLGVPPSGNALDFTVIDIIGVRDGKLIDHLVVLDQLTLLTQLGAIPAKG